MGVRDLAGFYRMGRRRARVATQKKFYREKNLSVRSLLSVQFSCADRSF